MELLQVCWRWLQCFVIVTCTYNYVCMPNCIGNIIYECCRLAVIVVHVLYCSVCILLILCVCVYVWFVGTAKLTPLVVFAWSALTRVNTKTTTTRWHHTHNDHAHYNWIIITNRFLLLVHLTLWCSFFLLDVCVWRRWLLWLWGPRGMEWSHLLQHTQATRSGVPPGGDWRCKHV